MNERVGLLIATVTLATAAGGIAAHAAEGFVCGPDRIVYVEAHEIEEKKRTDPCIAAFFGLKVETPAAPHPAATPAESPAAKPQSPARQPVQKPLVQPTRKDAAPALAPVVKAMVSLRPLPGEVPERAIKRHNAEQAALSFPATTAPGTDYRKIRVINAQSAETSWFHHAR